MLKCVCRKCRKRTIHIPGSLVCTECGSVRVRIKVTERDKAKAESRRMSIERIFGIC